MDIIGGLASTTQLVAYGYSVSKILLQLIHDIKEGPAAYREHKINIQLLLRVVSQVSQQTTESSEPNDLIINILVQISTAACRILALLRGTNSLIERIIHAPSRRSQVSKTLESLSAQKDLLHLHISQDNHRILSSHVSMGQLLGKITASVLPLIKITQI
ncbi:hypothetical protein F5B20DRAFT_520941 [Whalleya microplaca]|nr:hypothetical protein F5B20DRAFT_520941 [Whalleya microplaca]